MATTLQDVLANLPELQRVAQQHFAKFGPNPRTDEERDALRREDVWTVDDYLAMIHELEEAIQAALRLPPCTQERYEAELYARNRVAQRLYYRGRRCLRTNRVGVFKGAKGKSGEDWIKTDLSSKADTLAAARLKEIYEATRECISRQGSVAPMR